MESDELLSREEILAGFPAKRANTLLFLIENRVTRAISRSKVEFSLDESGDDAREIAFLEAFALGKSPSTTITIQQLERYAPDWQTLVPKIPRVQAALIHAFGQKYRFTRSLVPNLVRALDLEGAGVRSAYESLYKVPLDSVFRSRLSFLERVRWRLMAISRGIEGLPPLWLTILITIALGLPQAFLALPIATAELGPAATLFWIVLIGILNCVTMACMAESIGRSVDFRYGRGFIKQLAGNYLGDAGASILSLAVTVRVFLIALACYLGLSVTMADLTPISAPIWAIGLFFAGIYLNSRKSLNFTITLIVFLAGISVCLLLLLSLLSLSHLDLDNLRYSNVPFFGDRPFDPRRLQRVLGVSLMLYFGHVYTGECAKFVLPRDKNASSLIRGSVIGTAILTGLFCLWVVAVNGALSPRLLASQSGTVLEPLGELLGPSARILGFVLVTLLLGMAWLRSSSLLMNLTREWFPEPKQALLRLPARQGRLLLRPRGKNHRFPCVAITYLGQSPDNLSRFTLRVQSSENISEREIRFAGTWNALASGDTVPELDPDRFPLELEVVSTDGKEVYLKITTALTLAYEGVLEPPRAPRPVESVKKGKNTQRRAGFARFFRWSLANFQQKQRYFLTISPLLVIFGMTQGFFVLKIQSFTSMLGYAGVLGNCLVGGIFPVLLLVASRRKGEIAPGTSWRWFDYPIVPIAIYSFFLGILLLHALIIWENPVARLAAALVALLSLVATGIMLRAGAFTARAVVELREEADRDGAAVLQVTEAGKPRTARVCLGRDGGEEFADAAAVAIPDPATLRYARFHLPGRGTRELKVWVGGARSPGTFAPSPVFVEVDDRQTTRRFDLRLTGGNVLLPLNGHDCLVRLDIPENFPSIT